MRKMPAMVGVAALLAAVALCGCGRKTETAEGPSRTAVSADGKTPVAAPTTAVPGTKSGASGKMASPD